MCLLIGLLYVVGASENYLYADDSLHFANIVLHGEPINVHHIVLSLLHQVSTILRIHDIDAAILLFRLYVVLSSVLCLALIGSLALNWYGSHAAAIVAVLACALAFGYWTYSITTDLYVPASAFALLAIWLVDRSEKVRRPSSVLVMASISVVLCALNHQAYSLIAIPISAMLLLSGWRRSSFGQRLRRTMAFLVPVLAFGFGSFFLAFRASGGDDFVLFLRGYEAWMPMLPYDHLSLRTPLYALIGILRTLVFPDYMLRFDSIYEPVQRMFILKLLMDDRYLVSNMSPAAVITVLGFSAIACYSVLYFFVVAARRLGRGDRPAAAKALLGWVFVQTGFSALWEPTSNEFWIWSVPCFALLVATPATSRLRRAPERFLPWLLILSLVAANAPVVSRYTSPGRCIYRINKSYLSRVGKDDLVISGDGYPSLWLASLYRSPAAVINFYRCSFTLQDSSLQARIDTVAAHRGRIFLDPTLVMPNESELKLQAFFAQAKQIHVDVQESEEELRKLEEVCRTRGIPLYGINRRGGDVVPFQRRGFNGWLQYVSPDSVDTVGRTPRGSGSP